MTDRLIGLIGWPSGRLGWADLTVWSGFTAHLFEKNIQTKIK
jgi:hypothetical protein